MSEDRKRREDFLDRCLVEADSVAEALAMARELEGFVLGEVDGNQPPPSAGKKPRRNKTAIATVPAARSIQGAGQSGPSGGSTLLDDCQERTFIDMCIAGASIGELAAEFSLKTTQVYSLKKKHKVDIMAGAPKSPPLRVADQSEDATRKRARTADEAFGAAGASFGEDGS